MHLPSEKMSGSKCNLLTLVKSFGGVNFLGSSGDGVLRAGDGGASPPCLHDATFFPGVMAADVDERHCLPGVTGMDCFNVAASCAFTGVA